MTIVIHPAYSTVLANNAVFQEIHPALAAADLVFNGVTDLLVIVRVSHALECESGVVFEFFQILTAEDVKHRLVRIDQLFRRLRLIDKEPAGHMTADLFNDVEGLLIQFKSFICHTPWPPG